MFIIVFAVFSHLLNYLEAQLLLNTFMYKLCEVL